MSELSVRETAARALFGKRWTGMTFGRHPDLEDECREVATAVLAAVADHDGLADVLADALMQPTHAPLNQHDPETGDCVSCPWPVHALPAPHVAAHLADVVRAWLKGDR